MVVKVSKNLVVFYDYLCLHLDIPLLLIPQNPVTEKKWQWLSLFSVTVNMKMHSFSVLGEVAVSLMRQSVISVQ